MHSAEAPQKDWRSDNDVEFKLAYTPRHRCLAFPNESISLVDEEMIFCVVVWKQAKWWEIKCLHKCVCLWLWLLEVGFVRLSRNPASSIEFDWWTTTLYTCCLGCVAYSIGCIYVYVFVSACAECTHTEHEWVDLRLNQLCLQKRMSKALFINSLSALARWSLTVGYLALHQKCCMMCVVAQEDAKLIFKKVLFIKSVHAGFSKE